VNIKTWITGKLLADSTFTTAIGGQTHFFYGYPNSFSTLPVVAYSESGHSTTGYFDDASTAVESALTFDIYTNTSTSTVFDALASVMAANFFNLDFSTDLYETDAKMHHKTARFRRTVRSEDLV